MKKIVVVLASALFACSSAPPSESKGTQAAAMDDTQCSDQSCGDPGSPPPPPQNPPCLCEIAAFAKSYANGGNDALARGEPADAYDSRSLSLTIDGSGLDDRYRRVTCSQLCQNEARSTSANTVCVQLNYDAGLLLQ